jgi:hypothetical protein
MMPREPKGSNLGTGIKGLVFSWEAFPMIVSGTVPQTGRRDTSITAAGR